MHDEGSSRLIAAAISRVRAEKCKSANPVREADPGADRPSGARLSHREPVQAPLTLRSQRLRTLSGWSITAQ